MKGVKGCAGLVVGQFSQGLSPRSAGALAGSLRTYLRYRQFMGDHTESLIAAIPKAAAWSMARIPRLLTKEQISQFLHAFDTRTLSGQGGYAMAHLLVDLGLRAEEVAALQLSDIDWREGTLRIQAAKCKRVDSLRYPCKRGAPWPITCTMVVVELSVGHFSCGIALHSIAGSPRLSWALQSGRPMLDVDGRLRQWVRTC